MSLAIVSSISKPASKPRSLPRTTVIRGLKSFSSSLQFAHCVLESLRVPRFLRSIPQSLQLYLQSLKETHAPPHSLIFVSWILCLINEESIQFDVLRLRVHPLIAEVTIYPRESVFARARKGYIDLSSQHYDFSTIHL